MNNPFHQVIKISWLLCFALSIGSQATHAQVSRFLQAPYQQRTAQLRAFRGRFPNDTTRLFKSFDSLMAAAADNDDQLLYGYAELLKVDAQKEYRFKEIPHRIAFLKKNQPHFEQSPYPRIRAMFYFFLSQAYFANLDFEEAFKLAFRSEQIFEQIGYQNIPEVSWFLDYYFFIYYHFGDYRKAIEYAELTEKYNKYDVVGSVYLLSNRGEAYLKMGDYDNAGKLFLKAIELAKRKHKNVFLGIASGNYGNTLRLQGRFTEALPNLYADIAINEQDYPGNSAMTCLYISYCLLRVDSVAKAKSYLDRSIKLFSRREHKKGLFGRDYIVLYYDVKSLYAQKMGDYRSALKYRDSLLVTKDSLGKVFDNKLLMKEGVRHTAEKYLRHLETIEREKDNALQRRNIVIVAVVVITLLLLYWLNYRRQHEKQVRGLEKKRTDDLLAHATEQLARYVENIKSKNALIEKMSADLEQQKRHVSEPEDIEAHINELRQQVILTEQGWEQFRELFERVYPDFFDHLANMPADFSPAEIRLLALLKLDIPSKEAAFMLGISIESLRKARYRLRKKVDTLPIEVAFSSLVDQL